MAKRRTGTAGPMTADEMRRMRDDGDPVSLIISRAKIRNNMDRATVRAILFGGKVDG